jgi:co-chaperonin GroES (HSP10)
MDISARGDWIIGLPVECKDERLSGLILTESQKEAVQNRAIIRVVGFGPDVNNPAPSPEVYKPSGREIKVGDVLVHVRGGSAQKIDGRDTKTYTMVLVQDIIGHLDSDEEGNPDEVAERKKRIDAINEENRKRQQGGQLLVPTANPAAMPRKPMRLVETAGR